MLKKFLSVILAIGLFLTLSCTNATNNTVESTEGEVVGYFIIDIDYDNSWYWHNNADYAYDWLKTENRKEYYNVIIYVDKAYFLNKLYRGKYNFGYCNNDEIKIMLY